MFVSVGPNFWRAMVGLIIGLVIVSIVVQAIYQLSYRPAEMVRWRQFAFICSVQQWVDQTLEPETDDEKAADLLCDLLRSSPQDPSSLRFVITTTLDLWHSMRGKGGPAIWTAPYGFDENLKQLAVRTNIPADSLTTKFSILESTEAPFRPSEIDLGTECIYRTYLSRYAFYEATKFSLSIWWYVVFWFIVSLGLLLGYTYEYHFLGGFDNPLDGLLKSRNRTIFWMFLVLPITTVILFISLIDDLNKHVRKRRLRSKSLTHSPR
ncbi:hypothetical protein KKG41_04750 [Patescibacteria group bacterium]|nr:hypothetical protein [Patescibacteria group bacterium]MBU1890813.1 hypothetical protein [Patescibacteria group bacterium]